MDMNWEIKHSILSPQQISSNVICVTKYDLQKYKGFWELFSEQHWKERKEKRRKERKKEKKDEAEIYWTIDLSDGPSEAWEIK